MLWSVKGERRRVIREVGFKHGILTIVALPEVKSHVAVDCDCGRRNVIVSVKALGRLDTNTSCGSLCGLRPDPIHHLYENHR